ncbi:serine/threonine-protein phosphatase [Micromonospora orduensis]|uniref:Serine/threonine-protein phosphatase n=1 Tax=Micromonospora orduensis TaxID=1420891 RepID=A0A5C4QPE4_9ACTN|nr:PP2C family protein-serine/threonine phosphatase [Micromonospora orduensis]TNH28654.1 serine/threonine-protein phosphatase [Micromonospora orduensis]
MRPLPSTDRSVDKPPAAGSTIANGSLLGRWTRWLGLRLAFGFIAVVLLVDAAAGTHAVLIGFLALAPLFAAAVETPRRTAVVSATATTAAVVAGLPSGMLGSLDHLLRVAVVIAVSLMAVYVAQARTGREERLRRMAEIVRITQAAILREPPGHAPGVELAARYVSAYEQAGVGGDLYEVVVVDPRGLRIIVGDVCGKGLDAVRLASAVAGAFRQSAIIRSDLTQVARDLDDLVGREPTPATGATFVTAVLVELRGDEIRSVNCGHPAPILRHRSGNLEELEVSSPDRPLGLGGPRSAEVTHRWEVGDRLLLHTDGLIEARDDNGRFFPMSALRECLSRSSVDDSLAAVWGSVHRHVGGEPHDDIALLLAERRPSAAG